MGAPHPGLRTGRVAVCLDVGHEDRGRQAPGGEAGTVLPSEVASAGPGGPDDLCVCVSLARQPASRTFVLCTPQLLDRSGVLRWLPPVYKRDPPHTFKKSGAAPARL